MANYDDLNIDEKMDLFSNEYGLEEKSFVELAEKYGTYPNKLRREAIRLGIKIRDKSGAQKVALKQGRAKHPTEGTERTADTKIKISNGKAESWANMSLEARESIAQQARDQWANMSQADKELFRKKASDAVRLAAKEGSKLEKHVLEELVKAGYRVEFHKEHLLLNERLQLDLFLPTIDVAIEIDGPSHFLPIWGNKTLQRNKRADSQKNGLLLTRGIIVIRIKQEGTLSQKYKRDLITKLVGLLKEIEVKKPPLGQRYIEL